MKTVHLIAVGKLKNPQLEKIEKDYLSRINAPQILIHEVKAKAESIGDEGKEVLKKIQEISKGQSPYIIVLTEYGKELESPEFSQWIFKIIEKSPKVIFILGGAQGHCKQVLAMAKPTVSVKTHFSTQIGQNPIYRTILSSYNY